MDIADESSFDEGRNVAAVVDMSVREQKRIGLHGFERKIPIAMHRLMPTSLEHTAIDEKTVLSDIEPVHGSGDGSCGAQERDSKPIVLCHH